MARDPALLGECRALVRAISAYATLDGLRSGAAWPELSRRLGALLGAVRRYEAAGVPGPAQDAAAIRAVHWNIEHGNEYEKILAALKEHADLADADLYMFCEIDLGCARSGNRDVTGELAEALGRHGVWAPCFLETTPGRDDDPIFATGRENEEALIGVAILSRWPITDVRSVVLPGPEQLHFDRERMYGHHVALVATIARPGAPFVAATTHLEVHRTRAHRAVQMEVLVEALAHEKRPVVLSGDFNTLTFDRGTIVGTLGAAWTMLVASDRALEERFHHPDRGPARERLFELVTNAGFEYERFNDRAPTLAVRLERVREIAALPPVLRELATARVGRRQALRLDWFCGRGFTGGSGRTVPGLDRTSDHAPIVGQFMSGG